MKLSYLFLAAILIVFIVGVGFLLQQSDNTPKEVHIELYSDPYPMVLGSMNLKVSLTDENGDPIEGADVHAVTESMGFGSIPYTDVAQGYVDGYYTIPIHWTTIGQATVTIHAELDDEERYEEEFVVFIYTLQYISTENRRYRSEREIAEELADVPDNEYWIVVPMGAQEITATHFKDFVPSVITLNLSGKDTIVIRNDDFVDNSIGPFYVGAGETLRQTFYEPAVYIGSCTVNQGPVRIEILE